MAGVDYRQIQAPERVNTDLPDDGSAARAAELRRAFQEFEGASSDFGTKVAVQAGAIAGAASGATGHPQYREGLSRFSAYARAYNNAATGAYAVQAEAQADDAAARLRVQANNDPAAFQSTYSAVRDGVVKNAPAEAQAMLTELYNRRLAAGVAAISGDQATEIKETQRKTYDEGVARATSRVAILQGSENPHDQLQALDEHAKLSALIDGGVNAGLYSKAEAQAMHMGAMRTVTAEVFQTQIDRELSKPNGDVVGLLENFRKAHEANLSDTTQAPVLSEPEYQKLMADATTKIREQRLLDEILKHNGKTAEELKFEQGDVQYSSMLFQGKLTASALDAATRNGDLKPEVARGLFDRLAAGSGGKGNADLSFRLHTDPDFLNMKPSDFARYVGPGGLNGKQADELAQEAAKRSAGWEGTPAAKQARGNIDAALKIMPGTPAASLSDEQRKARTNAQQEFIQLQNSTEPAKRDGMAATNAQLAVHHAEQQIARDNIKDFTRFKESAIKNHGPGSADEWSAEQLQNYIKKQDDAIKAATEQAKGP